MDKSEISRVSDEMILEQFEDLSIDCISDILCGIKETLEAIRSNAPIVFNDKINAMLEELDENLCDVGAEICAYADDQGLLTPEQLDEFIPTI